MYQDRALQRKKIKKMILGENKENYAERNRIKKMLSAYMAEGYSDVQPKPQKKTNPFLKAIPEDKVDPLFKKLESAKPVTVEKPSEDDQTDRTVSLKNVLNRQKQGQDTRLMQEYLSEGKKELDNAYYEKRIKELKNKLPKIDFSQNWSSEPVKEIDPQQERNISIELNQLIDEYKKFKYEQKVQNAQKILNPEYDQNHDSKVDLRDVLAAQAAGEDSREIQNRLAHKNSTKEMISQIYNVQQKNYGLVDETGRPLDPATFTAGEDEQQDKYDKLVAQKKAEVDALRQQLVSKGYDVDALIDEYSREQNAVRRAHEKEANEKFAEEHPVAASVGSVLATPISALGILDFVPRGIKEMVTGEYEPVDPNNPLYFANQFKDDVRSKVSENMEGWQSFLYQTGLSIGDFLSIAPLSEVGSLAIMGSNAASSAALNVAENGGSATQALWTGAAAGAAEVLFEKISLDQLKLFKKSDKTGLKEGVKNIAKGMFTEGSEEAATDIANLVTDALINADNSDFNRAVKEYEKNGLTEEAAWKQAALDTVTNIGLDFAGGALSGAALSAGATALGAVDTARLGSDIKKGRTDFTLEDMAEAGKTTDPTSRAYQIADKVTTRQEQGKRIGNYQAGALYRENINETRKQTLSGLKEELSGEPEYKSLSRAFNKVTGGEKLSLSDAVTIQGSPKALTLLSEMTGETLQADSSVKQIKQAAQNYSFQTWTNEKIKKQLVEEREQLEQDAQESGLQLPTLPNLAKAVVNGTPVRVMGIQDIDHGTEQVRLSDGKTVSLDQVEFTDPKVQQVYRQAAQFDTTGAKEYVSNYTENPLYTGGFQAFYRSGKIGLTFQQAIQKSDAYAGQLSTETVKAAYDAGVQDYHAQVNAQQQKLEKSGKKIGSVEIHTTKPLTDKLKSQAVTLNSFAKKYGLQIELVDEIEGGIANGVYTGKNHIQIAADNLEQGMLFTALHEAGHYVKANNPKGFQELSDFVLETLDEMGYDVNKRITDLQTAYEAAGMRLSEADALEELVCDNLSVIAADEHAVGKLLSLDKNSKFKILEVLKSFLEKIKTIWTQLSGNEKVTEEYSVIEDMARRLEKSLNDAAYTKGQTTKEKNKFSIVKDISGRKIVIVDTNQEIFSDIPVSRYTKTVKEFINTQFKNKILPLSDYNLIHIDKTGNNKYLYSGKSVDYETHRAKMKAAMELDNLLEASEYIGHSNDKKYHRFATYGFDYYKTRFIVDGIEFEGIIDVGVSENGAYFYGMTNIKRTTPDSGKYAGPVPAATPELMSASGSLIDSSISQKKTGVNHRIRISTENDAEKMERTARNYDQAETSPTAISSNPSNNIISNSSSKNNNGTRKYSLNPDFIRQYDAWDKKDPLRHFKIGNTSKALKSIGVEKKDIVWDSSKIIKIKSKHPAMTDEIIKQVPNLLENPVVVMESKTVSGRLTMLGDVYDQEGTPVLAALELHPTKYGVALDEFKLASAYGKEHTQRLINTSRLLYVDPNKNRTDTWLKFTRLQLPVNNNQYGPINIISNAAEKSNQNVKKFSLKQPVEEAAGLMAVHNLTEEKLKKALKLGGLPVPSIAVVKAKNGNINFGEISLLFDKETIDPQNKENLVFDRDVYSNTYPEIVKKDGKSYLKQGKKLVPATLGNIVSAMKGNAVNSEQTQHYLIQNVAAAVARRFYSIDEIRHAKGKLMSVKEYEDHLTALLEREDDVSAQICFDRMVKEDAFEVLSDYYRAMTDYLTKGISARSALKRHSFTLRGIEADTISRFEEIAQSVKRLPTDVFEAKPQRAVGFDEVRAAIVPQGLDPSVKEALSSRGIEVVEYDPHMKGDRLRALNENKAMQFSLRGTEEDYNVLIKEYGAIKKGVNPARDIKVPKRSSDDKKVRQLTRTVLETETVTPELIDEIKKGIVNEDFSYTPISDKEAKNFADWKVNTDGMENAQKQWAQVTGGMRTATKKDIAVAEYMLLKAEANNDIETALRLINEISIEATRAGQVVQAMSMLKRLGGLGQLTYIKKTVDKLNAELQKRAKKNKPAPQITINEELAQNLIRAKTKEEVQRAADALLTDIAKQVPSTWVDKWNAWRYFSMLGNPRTHIRNLTGNAVFMPAISFKNVLAAGLEKVAGLNNSDMTYTKAVKVKQEYKDFALKDFTQVKDAVTSGGKMNPSDIIRDKQKIFGPKFLESLRKFNFNLLEKEDILFLRHHYARALSMYLQSNRVNLKSISENTLIKARQYAISEAQKATFRDASQMANMFNRFSHINRGTALVIEGMLPFKKTPINILKRGVEYSPIGLIKALTYDLSMLKKGEININEFIDGLACGLSGTMIMALGTFLASLGIIQGGMGDDKEGQFEKLKGVQEYSIQIGGVSYTIDWMAPASLPLFVGVELYNAIQGDYENATFADIADSLAQISEPVFEMSMLSGLNNTFDAISFSDNKITAAAEEIVTGYLSQAVPTVLGQTARTIDGTRRRTYIDKNSGLPSGAQRFVQKVMNKTPLSYLNQPYVDQWGREDTNDNIFLRALENFVSPGFISEIKPTELDDALTELYASTGDTGVLPSSPQKYLTVEGERIDLTGSQYTQLSKIRGNTAQRVLSEMIATPEYARLSDEEKASAVSFAYKYAAEVAKSEILESEIAVSWCRKAYNQENKSGGSVARYILRNKIK